MFSPRFVLAASAAAILAASPAVMAGTPDMSSCDVWLAACHYTSSNREASYDINRVVIHKTEGATAAGAAGWFANCSSGGSAHYTLDKSNGYCYQSVREKDVAWHAGYSSTNNVSVGIEHSGWVSSNDTSTACYDESALITRSAVVYYGVPCSRSYIIGHSEVPGCSTPGGGGTSCHTDPGRYWNWAYYMGKCGNSIPANPPYNFTAGTDGWAAGNAGSVFWRSEGWLGFDQTGSDPSIISPPTNFWGAGNYVARVRVMPSGGSSWNHNMQLFWQTADSPSWSEAKSSGIVGFQAINGFVDICFDLRKSTFVGKNVIRFRLDFDNTDVGTAWYVDQFALFSLPCPAWNFDASVEGWSAASGFSSFGWNAAGAIVAQQVANDSVMTWGGMNFNGLAGQRLWVRIYPEGGADWNHSMQVFWRTTDSANWREDYSSGIVAYQAVNGWVDIYLPLANNWAGKTITGLRLDLDDRNVNTRFWIDRIGVVSN